MPTAESLSQGLANALACLATWGRREGTTCFPPRITPGDLKVRKDEDLHHWFESFVDHCLGGEPRACSIEEDIALAGFVSWEAQNILTAAAMHAIVTPGGCIDDLYAGACKAHYLRLDYHPNCLGSFLMEPSPHVHVGTSSVPRMFLGMGRSGNAVADFLEFIFRTYRHQQWLSWAQGVWRASAVEDCESEDPSPRIVAAFEAGQTGVLQQHHAIHMRRWKEYLLRAKESWFIPRCEGTCVEVLAYP